MDESSDDEFVEESVNSRDEYLDLESQSNWNNPTIIEEYVQSIEKTKYAEYCKICESVRLKKVFLKYEFYFKHDSEHSYFKNKPTFYRFIMNYLSLEESEENQKSILNGLRCLYHTPYLFNYCAIAEFDAILKCLIRFIKSDNDDIFIYSLKCLQGAFIYSESRNYRFYPSDVDIIFNIIWELLHNTENNLTTPNSGSEEIIDPASGESQTSDTVEEEDDEEKGTDLPELKEYILFNTEHAYYFEFHAVALLYSMVKVLRTTSNIILSDSFRAQFHSDWLLEYIDFNKFNNSALNAYMAAVILNLCSDALFLSFLVKSEILPIVLKNIMKDESSQYLKSVLKAISENSQAVNEIIALDVEILHQMIDIIVDDLRNSTNPDAFNFLENVLKIPAVNECVNKSELLEKIIDEIEQMEWITRPNSNIDNIDSLIENTSVLSNFIKFLATIIYSEFYREYTKSIDKKLITVNSIEWLYEIAKHFSKIGGIKNTLSLPTYFEEDRLYELLLHMCQRFCLCRRLNEIYELRLNLFYLLFALSCYSKTADKIKNCRIFPKFMLDSGRNYFSTLRMILITLVADCQPKKLPIFEILTNLIRFEIPISACLTNESLTYFVDVNKSENSIFEKILENQLLYCIFKFSRSLNSDEEYEMSTHALKTLYFLSFYRRACQIMSMFEKFFRTKLPLKITNLFTSKCTSEYLLEYCIYSIKLVCRVNSNFFTKYYFYKENIVNLKLLDTPMFNSAIEYLKQQGYTETVDLIMDSVKYSKYQQAKEQQMHENFEKNKWDIIMESGIGNYYKYDLIRDDGSLLNPAEYDISQNVIRRKTQCSLNFNKFRKNSMRTLLSARKLKFSFLNYSSNSSRYVQYLKNDDLAVASQNEIVFYDKYNFNELYKCTTPAYTNSLSSSHDNSLFVASASDSYIFNIESLKNATEQKYATVEKIINCEFTHDNKHVIGISENLHAIMFDIEANAQVQKFWDPDLFQFHDLSRIDITRDDKILLFNADIYCTRSGKMIHSFETFNKFNGGIFDHTENEIIIGEQFWDMRTLKLIEIKEDFKDKFIRKNTNTNYYYAC